MKTVVLNGSPNQDGFTMKLVKQCFNDFDNTTIYDAYKLNVSACTDCKYCDNKFAECSIDDEMNVIYEAIKDADNLVIATPIHVASVSAPLLAIMTRFQIYFAVKFKQKKEIPLKKKKGFLIVTAGSDWPKHFENVKTIVETSFLETNTRLEAVLYRPHTDQGNDNYEIEDFIRKLRGV